MKQQVRILSAAIGLLWCGAARAESGELQAALQPFATHNQYQMMQVFGLPIFRHYQVLPDGARSADFVFDLTNHFSFTNLSTETLIIDGEQYQARLIYRQGLGDNLEWALEVPLTWHSGGFLDGFIDDFHDTFGLVRGRRGSVPDDQINYFYQRDGVTQLDIDDSKEGIGDIRLVLTRQLQNMPAGRGASISGLLKLPTGDADKLTGSGGADVAAWFTYGAEPAGGSRWSWQGSVGAIYASDGDLLERQRRNSGLLGSFTLGWRWTETVQLKGQVYTHSSLYKNTRMKSLKELAVLGTIGWVWHMTPDIDLDFGLVEDLHEGVGADATLHFAVRRRI